MKKTALSILLFNAFVLITNAQCTLPLVTGSYTQVSSNTTLNATGGIYWICSGLTVTIASSQGDVYVCENNVTLNIVSSAGDAVYAKPGCIINNSSPDDIGVTGNPANITINNTGSGTTTLVQACNPLGYDYSLVVGGPGACVGSGITEANTIDADIFPSPFSDFIIINGTEGDGTITISNALGQNVLNEKIVAGQNEIKTIDFPAGVYMLRIETTKGLRIKKIIKN